MSDREQFQEARTAGLKARHETRQERAIRREVARCPMAPHHHLMETCDCGYQYEYPAPDKDHMPIGIRTTDVGPFIRCSCGKNPSPHHWLAAHWPGDKAGGKRLADEMLAREIGSKEAQQ